MRMLSYGLGLALFGFLSMSIPGCGNDAPAARIVEAACGECQFGLPGNGCDLAVRIDGKAYFVDGTSIDEHGDAHAADGLCNAVRQAHVAGNVVDGRFAAQSFVLLPVGE